MKVILSTIATLFHFVICKNKLIPRHSLALLYALYGLIQMLTVARSAHMHLFKFNTKSLACCKGRNVVKGKITIAIVNIDKLHKPFRVCIKIIMLEHSLFTKP